MNERASPGTHGKQGEMAAVRFLSERGWEVLEHNLRTRFSEVDLVVRRESTIAFVEVKSWRNLGFDELERSIGPRKRQKIRTAARKYLSERPELTGCIIRFDVVFMQGEQMRPIHIEDAFGDD